MKKFVANYTIVACQTLVNHIAVIGDDSTLLELRPLDDELANTRYIAAPLCIVPQQSVTTVARLVTLCHDKDDFCRRFFAHYRPVLPIGRKVAVLELDFEAHSVTRLA